MAACALWSPQDPAGSPFLCPAELHDDSIHFYFECSAPRCVSTLSLDDRSLQMAASKLKESFGDMSNSTLHNFFRSIGTHFVWRVTYGYKAELHWEVAHVPGRLKGNSEFVNGIEKDFRASIKQWQEEGFKSAPPPIPNHLRSKKKDSLSIISRPRSQSESQTALETEKAPAEHPDVIQRWGTTQHFSSLYQNYSKGIVDTDLERNSMVVIKIELMPILHMFDTSKIKRKLEAAIASYYLRRKPLTNKSLEEQLVVAILCPENGKWVRANATGNLIADMELQGTSGDYDLYQLPDECLFSVKNNPAFNRFALYSIRYNKLVLLFFWHLLLTLSKVSRGNTKPRFRFRYLPINIIGSHESFTISGNYLMHFGTW